MRERDRADNQRRHAERRQSDGREEEKERERECSQQRRQSTQSDQEAVQDHRARYMECFNTADGGALHEQVRKWYLFNAIASYCI